MVRAQFFEKILFRTLLKLIRKHGIDLVLQGVIIAAKTDKDQRAQILAKDLEDALAKYRRSN